MRQLTLILLLILLGTGLFAMGRTQDSGDGIRVNGDMYAIDGYDAVAYFSLPADVGAIQGSPAYAYSWRGADWLFASNENRELFKAGPEKYAPNYGGYGAKAMSEDKLDRSDPDVWEIFEGELYLFSNKTGREEWRSNPAEKRALADKFWPAHLTELWEKGAR